MRRCRKLISMIVMMAMLATMTPYQVLAADTTAGGSTDTAVETTPTVVDEQEEGTEKEEGQKVDEDQNDNEDLKGDEGLKDDESQKVDEEPKADVDEEDKEDPSTGESGSETGDEGASNAAAVTEEISDNKPAEPAETAGNAASTVPAQEEKKEVKLSEGTISKEAGGYTVKAEGMLPEGAELVLTRLSDETLAEVAEGLEKEDQTAVFAYDVTIKDAEGKTWQPEELGVKITIKGIYLQDKAEVSVCHVLDKEEAVQKAVSDDDIVSTEVSLSSDAAQELKTAVEAAGKVTNSDDSVVVTTITEEKNLEVNPVNDEISFKTDSFSTFIVFTVDFEYEDFAYSIKGESSILLSELFAALNIEQDLSAVTSAAWEERAQYDPNELVSIEAQDGDWKLTSLKAFDTEETLIVTAEGGKIYRIKVTDDPDDQQAEEDYTFEVDFNDKNDTRAGESYTWLSTATFEMRDKDGEIVSDNTIRDNYEFRIINVTSENDTTFVWNDESDHSAQSSYVLSSEQGMIYTVTFNLYNKTTNEPVGAADGYTLEVKTYNTSQISDEPLTKDDQYIRTAKIAQRLSGTGPFDENNDPGNDENEENDIVRSFDYVTYRVNVSSAGYSETYYKQGWVGYLILLADENNNPIAQHDAEFTASSLEWKTTNSDIPELNGVVNGSKKFTVNGVENTYRYIKVYKYLNAEADQQGDGSNLDSAFPIAQSQIEFMFKVGGMANGSKIKPLIWTWVYGNEVDQNNLYTDYSDPNYPACSNTVHDGKENGGKELVPVPTEPLTISAIPRYNVQLKEAYGNKGTLTTYNFNSGNDPANLSGNMRGAPNYGAGNVYGRFYGYAVTLQLYNSYSSVTGESKGLKGIEMPTGPITFKLDLSGSLKNKDNTTYQINYDQEQMSAFTPLLWMWRENGSSNHNLMGRGNVYEYYGNNTSYYAGPINKRGDSTYSHCYDGGTWNVDQNGTTLSFTVNNYQIDPSWFPMGDYPLGNTYTYYRGSVDNCTIGCFSCCELWFVVPIKENGKNGTSLLDKEVYDENGQPVLDDQGNPVYYKGSGTTGSYTIKLTESSIHATSVGGQVFEDTYGTNDRQMNKNDDVRTRSVDLSLPSADGNYSFGIQYSDNSTNMTWQVDFSGSGDPYTNAATSGRDVGEISQPGSIRWIFTADTKGNEINSITGLNYLMKFDDAGLTFNSGKAIKCDNGLPTPGGGNKYLFAAKKDGSGWNHYGLKPDSTDSSGTKWYYDASSGDITTTPTSILAYDAEMVRAVEEDLEYYSSYADLEAAGATCVGILQETRTNKTSLASHNIISKAYFTVKDDADMMNYVYATCNSVTYWTYDKTDFGTIPSRMEVQEGTAQMPAATGKDKKANYIKTTYNSDGNISSGHQPTGATYGDSVYIIPFKPEVYKNVAQRNADNTIKTTFDLDAKQNTVDFQLRVRTTKRMENPATDFVPTTTVYLTDTIPKSVQYKNDAVFGGTYTQSSTRGYHGSVEGGAQVGETFTYTAANGMQVDILFSDAEVSNNSNGTTTVKYTFENFPVGEGDFYIYYSADVDSGAATGTTFTNTVRVDTEDVHPNMYNTDYHTLSQASFKVTRAASLSLNKLTEKYFVDVTADIGYVMTWQNTGKNAYKKYPLFDVLPFNGDDNGTSYHGEYTLTAVKLLNNNGTSSNVITDFSNLEVRYTTDEYIRTLTDEELKAIENSTIVNDTTRWKQATIADDGTVTGYDPNTVAFCILIPEDIGIDAGKMVQASCTISPTNNEPGDLYGNRISVMDSIANARAIVLNRLVSGRVWYETNPDGERKTTEKTVAGVKVMLVRKAEYDTAVENGTDVSTLTPVQNLRKENCVLESTGADGSYEFGYLPAGDFVILFLSTDATDLSKFIMTEKQASGVREANNSNTDAVNNDDGTIDYGYINITMPTVDEITSSPYKDRYEDMGILATADITANKVWDNADGINTIPDGAEVTFTLTGNGLSLETTLDGTADDELETDSATQASYGESEDWKAAFNDLPRYTIDADGYAVEAEYKVEETEGWENYEVRYSDNAAKLKNEDNATITNKIKNGDLEISKTIVSPIPAESTQSFDFTIVLDPAVTMTYNTVTKDSKGTETKGTVSFTEGKQTVTVAGGSTLTILELPAEMTYKVTEVAAEGSVFDLTDSSGAEGTIEADKTKTAAFTNTRKTGSLEVTKEVVNKNDTNTAKEFTFTVTLEDTTITGTLGEGDNAATFDKGVTTFTLKDGETKTIDGLPSGIGYTVVETAEDGFVTRYEGTTGEDGSGDAEGQAGGTEGQTDGDETDDPEGEPAEETDGISGTIVEKETETVKVINTYMTEGEYAVEVKKVLEGRLLREGQFEFELSDSEGVLQTVKNGADGTVKFDPIVFTEEDLEKETEGEKEGYFKEKTEKTYTVKEVIPEGAKDNGDGTFTLDGYTYDAKEQAVTVSLKDNGDGTITAEADKKIEDLTFTNIYAADGEVFIGGTKVLEGQDLKEGQFKFVLSDESGKKVLEATNDANGNFEFEVIRFELSDLGGEKEKVFSYGVAEINDGQSNITYDKTAYTVKVTVTDNGDGTLTAKADKSRGEIRFTNKYTPPETPKEDKPKHKKSNNTGDSANGALWALMLLLAGGALAGTIWFRRRKKI